MPRSKTKSVYSETVQARIRHLTETYNVPRAKAETIAGYSSLKYVNAWIMLELVSQGIPIPVCPDGGWHNDLNIVQTVKPKLCT